MTVEQNTDGTLSSVFPYMIGLTFYGELQDNAIATCNVEASSPGPIINRASQAHFPEDHDH